MGRPPSRETIRTELGEEVKCAKCKEFWPADLEFFYFSNGRPHSWCKACYRSDPKVEAKQQRWLDGQKERRDNARTAASGAAA